MKNTLIHITLLAACPARGQGILQFDQQVSNTSPPGVYANVRPDPSGQSFTPGLSSVGSVQFYFRDIHLNGTGSTIHVNLWADSIANGTLLGSTAPVFLPDRLIGATTFFFSSPVEVTPGTTYYLQPFIESGDSFATGEVPGFLYAAGTAFFQGAENPGSDFWFRTGVVVPEPSTAAFALLSLASVNARRRIWDHSEKISLSSQFKRCMIWWRIRSVALCWHCSSRCKVEGGSPTFRENSTNVRSPRFLRRNTASCFSRTSRTYGMLGKSHSVCGIL